MTSSYSRAMLRRYQKTHPWAKKLPKKMLIKKDRPIDLGVIALYDEYGDLVNSEEEARNVGDGAWAIVYDTTRKGEWLWDLADNGWADHICSECRYTVNTDIHVSLGSEYNHCPRCGADMTKEHGITFIDTQIIVR
ncbi:MAG: hypothetical protein J6Y78_15635 [Paludibacteraceae bacterium]|nr:hypothetical protein [Paludibacteraceae bacterium]